MRVRTVTWRDLPARHSPYCEQSSVSPVEVSTSKMLITSLGASSNAVVLGWVAAASCKICLLVMMLTCSTDSRPKCSVHIQTSAVLCGC